MSRASHGRGFSLIEVLISVILVGLSITALMVANGAFSMANAAGADLSTAEFLVEQIRELTMLLPLVDPEVTTWTSLGPGPGETTLASYDDVDDFDGATFSPPIDANRVVLNAFADYTQLVTVQKLNPSDFDEVWADTSSSNFARVTVRVLRHGAQVSSMSWIRARY